MTQTPTHAGERPFLDALAFTFRRWRAQPWRLAAVFTCALAVALGDVLAPFFAGRLINALAHDAAGDGAPWRDALRAFCALTGLGLASTVLRQTMLAQIIHLTLKMMSDIAGDAFRRLQRFSTDWHTNSFAGSTVRKITRGLWGLDLLNDTLLMALWPSFAMLVGTTLLLGVHWPVMGEIVGVGSIIYIVVTAIMSLHCVAPAARLGNHWDTRLGGALADAITCNPVVKAFGAETREEARLGRVISKWRARLRRAWGRSILSASVQSLMLVAMQATMLGVALWLWRARHANVGDIAFALTTFLVMQGYLRDMGMHIRNLQRAINDMEELVALERQPLGIENKPCARPIRICRGEIRFEHVTFGYRGTQRLYQDFSLEIAAGERIGLVGYSGSGKTTFIKLVQRLYDVAGGRILIDGQDIAQATQASLRSQIAIVQQEPLLFHRTLAENIAYARPDAGRADIEHAARLASAHEFIAALPHGYDTLVGERGLKLSGGERQRVAIARAFLANAPVLILDEATSSLDSESEAAIQQAMARLMIGRTTIVVAHRLSTVRALDRLIVLDRGRIVEQGKHHELIRRDGSVYRKLFERQALELAKGLVGPSG
ncbi:ABC transporter ATP-binding protein [Pandoraea oxalativorans]|uniref:Multidrug ABC transporter ATP-binding protein n=1 Tax=Pandoraea oxalativorans TaxID=573737 RepID=A0A0G3IGC6_9BURK|nr:ABC transporter ATP-binding protein [Pandoraea oxalativorans]AKK24911.1 multidrug ABC transporter ATP-binding protein [Pandoraea oxalativorans]